MLINSSFFDVLFLFDMQNKENAFMHSLDCILGLAYSVFNGNWENAIKTRDKQIVGKYVREIRHENALIDHQLL